MVFLVNKPEGVLSTAADTHGRRTIVDLVPSRGARLYPVGRLDADSTGLILVTNDGDLAQRLTHPSFEVPRTYRATVRPVPVPERALRTLREGVDLDDGRTAPAKVRQVKPGVLELTIHEGPQPPGQADVRGDRPSRATRCSASASDRCASTTCAEGAHRRLKAAEVEHLRRTPSGRVEPTMRLFALRGASSVDRNDAHAILGGDGVAAARDPQAQRPASQRRRQLHLHADRRPRRGVPGRRRARHGFSAVPLLCAREVPVPGALPRVIRVLMHYHAPDNHVTRHVYLGAARALRQDLEGAQ